MAARTRRTTLNERWREKIKTSQIINRVQKCANGEVELTPVQLKAAEILLKKTMPDLKQSDIKQEISGSIGLSIEPKEIVSALERKYAKPDG